MMFGTYGSQFYSSYCVVKKSSHAGFHPQTSLQLPSAAATETKSCDNASFI